MREKRSKKYSPFHSFSPFALKTTAIEKSDGFKYQKIRDFKMVHKYLIILVNPFLFGCSPKILMTQKTSGNSKHSSRASTDSR
jgi:hypothetical protein